MTTVEPMSNVPEVAQTVLAGRTRGRVVIDTCSRAGRPANRWRRLPMGDDTVQL